MQQAPPGRRPRRLPRLDALTGSDLGMCSYDNQVQHGEAAWLDLQAQRLTPSPAC
jgi:hypothetical protein